MNISLIDVDKSNLSDYVSLEKKNDLSYYMSRTRPYNYDDKVQSTLFCKYICIKNTRIGALWLEKEIENTTTATLGVFISDNESLCKGIGTKAIELAIIKAKEKMKLTKVELHVREDNTRAFRCYEKCGFRESNRYVKEYLNENVCVIVMCRIL